MRPPWAGDGLSKTRSHALGVLCIQNPLWLVLFSLLMQQLAREGAGAGPRALDTVLSQPFASPGEQGILPCDSVPGSGTLILYHSA